MKTNVGIIGLGYWGPNYLRNFANNSMAKVTWICDISKEAIRRFKGNYPKIQSSLSYKDLLNDKSLDCIAVATPPESHYEITREFLSAKKHVFIAKPLARNLKNAEELVNLATKNKVILFTDLTYLYSREIEYIKNYIQNNKLGGPLYVDSNRSNFGIIQKSVNVIWDLAPHDLSIIDLCLGLKPKNVMATGNAFYNSSGNVEVAQLTIEYEKNFTANLYFSWLSPIKRRNLIISGTRSSIVYDDTKQKDKLSIYEKSIIISKKDKKISYISGNVKVPKLRTNEPLKEEISVFLNAVNQQPQTLDKNRDLKILRILEASDTSLKTGKIVRL